MQTTDEILAEIETLSRELEHHHTMAWIIERKRDELRSQLRQAGWAPSKENLPC